MPQTREALELAESKSNTKFKSLFAKNDDGSYKYFDKNTD